MNNHYDVIISQNDLNPLTQTHFLVMPDKSDLLEKLILRNKTNSKNDTYDESDVCQSYDELDSIFMDLSFIN